MKAIWKTVRIVACFLIGAGLVLSIAGFALAGFDGRVFSATIDRGTVTLGGTVVDDPSMLPIVSTIAEMGSIEYGVSAGDEGASVPETLEESEPSGDA
ncbi:MAG: hypothetical protein KH142_05075 [Slackia piriformis]|uniref:Uncharacterized protein n=1 Tax=Slackia piriformis TaxID=626934 RepID=A0A943V0B7_9ACTN|nr:hypothetical protein [Slackia piriformis]